jgi:hypothetical protein
MCDLYVIEITSCKSYNQPELSIITRMLNYADAENRHDLFCERIRKSRINPERQDKEQR